MKTRSRFLIPLLVLAGLALAACSPASAASLKGTWGLVSYGDPASLTPAAPDVETFIEFKDGQMSGNVGCNGFGGEYEADGDAIKFGPIVSTMMFCEGLVGEQEAATLAVFHETAAFALDGDMLTVTSADGSSVVVLSRK